MNTAQAAALAGCKRGTILKAIREKRLPAWKPGGRDWQINEADFENWQANRRKAGRPRQVTEVKPSLVSVMQNTD